MSRRTATNFVVDAVAFAAFVLLVATGLVERYLLPPGTGRFQSLAGMNRHQWGEVHFWIAMVLMTALAAHILLHWNWIVCVIRGRKTEASGYRVALGIVGLFGLLGLSAAPFLATVEQTGEPGRRRHQEPREQGSGDAPSDSGSSGLGDQIRGSMTLEQVERMSGMSADRILRELGVPPDVSRDETLGRLRRTYGFEMHDVRRIVETNMPPE